VEVLTSSKLQGGTDDVLRNLAGEQEAGYGPQDAVLGGSSTTPGLFDHAIEPVSFKDSPLRMLEAERESR
jgi:hypothetical protein